jgi:hypothetical protein
MAKKGSLFLLVKSLSKSEKRYFKIFAAGGSRDTNYLRLFDFIDKQKAFDDSAIHQHFKGSAFTEQLHVAKIYLSELILKSLRNYYADESVNGRLLDLLRDVEILYNRELYDASLLKLEKAEKLAVRYERLPLLLEIKQWKRKMAISHSSLGPGIVDEILQTEKLTLGKLLDLHEYWDKTHHVFEAVKRKDFLKQLDKRKTTTLQSLTLHRHLLYTYYLMNRQSQKAEREIAMLIGELEKHPVRVADDPASYATTISNKIGLLLREQRWEEVEVLINAMRAVPLKYKLGQNKFTVRLWLRIFNLELELYRDSKQLSKGLALIREVESFLNKHKTGIPDNYRIMLYYQITCIYFLKGNYSKSLKWVNEIVNANFGETRNELQCYARLLNLVIHFELNNIIVLRYAVDSCRRFFKKKKLSGGFENELLALFSRLSVAPAKEYRQIFERSYCEINSKHATYAEKAMDYIDIKGWIEGKIK